jgi:hypothetical protein
MKFFRGPPTQTGAYIFLMAEYLKLKLEIKDSSVCKALILLPATPTFAFLTSWNYPCEK